MQLEHECQGEPRGVVDRVHGQPLRPVVRRDDLVGADGEQRREVLPGPAARRGPGVPRNPADSCGRTATSTWPSTGNPWATTSQARRAALERRAVQGAQVAAPVQDPRQGAATAEVDDEAHPRGTQVHELGGGGGSGHERCLLVGRAGSVQRYVRCVIDLLYSVV